MPRKRPHRAVLAQRPGSTALLRRRLELAVVALEHIRDQDFGSAASVASNALEQIYSERRKGNRP